MWREYVCCRHAFLFDPVDQFVAERTFQMESLVFTLILLLSALPMEQGNASVDFDTQIIPLLTKAGCNTGAGLGVAAAAAGLTRAATGFNGVRATLSALPKASGAC